MDYTIAQIAKALGADFDGDGEFKIVSAAEPVDAEAADNGNGRDDALQGEDGVLKWAQRYRLVAPRVLAAPL